MLGGKNKKKTGADSRKLKDAKLTGLPRSWQKSGKTIFSRSGKMSNFEKVREIQLWSGNFVSQYTFITSKTLHGARGRTGKGVVPQTERSGVRFPRPESVCVKALGKL
jgi:hypothetical protein